MTRDPVTPMSPAASAERLPLLAPSKQGLFVRLVRFIARRKLGRDTGPMRVMSHHAGVLAGVGAMELALERCGALPARLKSLAQVQAARRIGCPF